MNIILVCGLTIEGPTYVFLFLCDNFFFIGNLRKIDRCECCVSVEANMNRCIKMLNCENLNEKVNITQKCLTFC